MAAPAAAGVGVEGGDALSPHRCFNQSTIYRVDVKCHRSRSERRRLGYNKEYQRIGDLSLLNLRAGIYSTYDKIV